MNNDQILVILEKYCKILDNKGVSICIIEHK